MTRARCPDCDRPLATQADYDAHPSGCICRHCLSLCWSTWNLGSVCEHPPVDWRARALALEEKLAAHGRSVAQGFLDQGALNQRIAALETGLREAAALIESWVQSESQYPNNEDDPDWQAAQRLSALASNPKET